MFRSLGFGFLCCLAIGSGVAAVSVPFEGRTASEHIRGLFEAPAPKRAAAKARPDRTASPAAAAAPGKAEPVATRPQRPQENDPTAAERAALDDLLGGKAR